MNMHLLFSMLLAGSMIFLIYLIIRPAAVRYFSAAWRYGFLKGIQLIFLLLYQYFKYTYIKILEALFAEGVKMQTFPILPLIQTEQFLVIREEH